MDVVCDSSLRRRRLSHSGGLQPAVQAPGVVTVVVNGNTCCVRQTQRFTRSYRVDVTHSSAAWNVYVLLLNPTTWKQQNGRNSPSDSVISVN